MGDSAPITVRIGSDTLQAILDHTSACGLNEACGILLGRRGEALHLIEEAVPSPNVTRDDPRTSYAIDPHRLAPLLLAARRTRDSSAGEVSDGSAAVLGFYHSHPQGDAVPSLRDVRDAWTGKTYLIVALGNSKPAAMRCWRRPEGMDEMMEDAMTVLPERR